MSLLSGSSTPSCFDSNSTHEGSGDKSTHTHTRTGGAASRCLMRRSPPITVLPQGPRVVPFLMSEVPLYQANSLHLVTEVPFCVETCHSRPLSRRAVLFENTPTFRRRRPGGGDPAGILLRDTKKNHNFIPIYSSANPKALNVRLLPPPTNTFTGGSSLIKNVSP